MLSWALIFFIVAVISALLGFSGIAGTASGLAQVLFVIAIILFLASLIYGNKRP